MQRKQKTSEDGTLCIYATEADFAAANDVFTLLNGTAGGQESKLTKKEADLLATIQKADRAEFTIQDLQRLTGGSYSSIYRTIKGYDSRGKNYTGLLEKCPALSFTDRTVTMNEEDGITVRRRTEAFAWDQELFRFWANGGACWLDRDPKNGDGASGSLQQLQQVSSNLSADAENGSGGSCSSSFTKEENNEDNSFLEEGDLQQNRDYAGTLLSEPDSQQCAHNSRSAANENRSLTGLPRSGYPGHQHSSNSCSACTQDAATVRENEPLAAKQNVFRAIAVADYKHLNPPEPQTACFVCGKSGAWFVEKLTAERKARSKDQQSARRVCRSCYQAAVKAEQMAKQPLPGTLDISRCVRITNEVGACSVCGLEKAAWADCSDPGVKLCEHCYGREVRVR